LEERLSLNSSNSSKPPSSDGLSKPAKPALKPMPQSLRKKSGKRPGGQAGHAGKTLKQTADPDAVITHRPAICRHCTAALSETTPSATYSRRQVFEMPEPKVIVTEHRALTLVCECCGKETSGAFPADVTQPLQYGPNLLGTATYLHTAHLIPFARCARIMQELTGARFSQGSLHHAPETAHE
jgi:transposase